MPKVSEQKRTTYILSCLDASDRRYVYSENSEAFMKKEYEYLSYDKRLMRFHDNEFGTTSDAFILLAVTTLGVANKETIRIFLMALKKRDPNLQIPDFKNNPKSLGNRLSELKKCGFLFTIEYGTYVRKGTDSVVEKNTLYTVDQQGQNFANARLGKSQPYNQWIQAKQFNDLIAWASATFCGCCLAYSPNFVSFERGLFSSKGRSVFLPCEIRFRKKDRIHYVAVLSCYLRFDDRYMSKQDYDNRRGNFIRLIYNYVTRGSNGDVSVVIVAEGKEDLKNICDLIAETGALDDVLEKVYFTGEGVILHSNDFRDTLVRLMVTDNGSYEFSAVVPEFMKP